jgi:hypothetical protein
MIFGGLRNVKLRNANLWNVDGKLTRPQDTRIPSNPDPPFPLNLVDIGPCLRVHDLHPRSMVRTLNSNLGLLRHTLLTPTRHLGCTQRPNSSPQSCNIRMLGDCVQTKDCRLLTRQTALSRGQGLAQPFSAGPAGSFAQGYTCIIRGVYTRLTLIPFVRLLRGWLP